MGTGVTSESSLEQAGPVPAGRSAAELPGKLPFAHEILSAIIHHHKVSSILQMVADALVSLYPSRGVAIFVLSGSPSGSPSDSWFQIKAEAGLPERDPGPLLFRPASPLTEALAASPLRDYATANFPSLEQILNSGVRLSRALPMTSGSGEPQGVFTVFDRQHDPLDEPALDAIQTLCDLARLAMEHDRLYDQAVQGGRPDERLQTAKGLGGRRVKVYSSALRLQSQRAADMAGALIDALAKSQFHMAYQPVFTPEGEIVGFEALLRWQHPAWGAVSPTEFIPTAEKSGLIVPIGDWVIDEVCRQALEWKAAHLPPIKMFANVSGVQLEQRDFSSKIARALTRSGLAPDRLELEITESWAIADLEGAAGKLQQLRDLGISIALDDFGTGYAAFDYLQELPLDTLKIDRSFIQRLDRPGANVTTVRAMTILARQLGLKTVAEGVESQEHVRQLRAIGCDLMQGFLLGRPLKPEAASLLLRSERRPPPLLPAAATNASPIAPAECLIG